MTLAATDSALVWTGFVGQKHAPDTSAWPLSRDNPVLRQTAEQLQQYFAAYGAVGEAIGRPKAVRAVGAAIGRNPISIIVPCHRVVGSTGALTGYAGGVERKHALLHLEGVL